MCPCSSRAYNLQSCLETIHLQFTLAVKKKSRRNTEQIPPDLIRFHVCDQKKRNLRMHVPWLLNN